MANYRPVICVETGETFGSIKEAAEHICLSANAVGMAIRGACPTAGGYHWEYAPKEDLEEYVPPKPTKKRSGPIKTIEQVQKEAERRSKETGRRIRYAHIQKEETLQLYSGWKLSNHLNKKRKKEEKK